MDASANVLETLKKTLEKKGEQQVLEMRKNKTISEEGIVNIMKEGEKEFVKKTGRNMTYGEMREMYGWRGPSYLYIVPNSFFTGFENIIL